MKKLFFTALFAILGFSAFADEKMQRTIKDFLNEGSFIAIEEKSSAVYYLKSIIAKISCDDNKFSFTYVDEEFEYESESFNYNKVLIISDEKSNIIIKE